MGVEMPGAKAHNDILGQFHLSLSEDDTFLELLHSPASGGLPSRCAALEFCRRVVQSEVDQPGNPQIGADERQALLRDVVDVAGIEACLSSCPQGIAFRNVVRKLIPLLEESRAGIRDIGDAQRVCRGLEMLCLIMRSVRYKQLGMASFVEALGVEYDGEQLVRSLIAQACRVLEHEGSSNFCCTLALKLLNVLAGTRVAEKDAVILQWLWEGGTLTVVGRLLENHRRFRHCLSLDTAVLQVCVGLNNLSASSAAACNYADLGDGISSVRCMLAVLESVAVLADIACNHMLTAKTRKASTYESLLLGKPVVIVDPKITGDLLAEGGTAAGQMCYAEAFALGFYYLSTRHRRQLVEAFSARIPGARGTSDSPTCTSPTLHAHAAGVAGGAVAGGGGGGVSRGAARGSGGECEMSAAGPDGLPLCFGSLLLFLSFLLHRPTGKTARYSALLLRALMPLVEEEAVMRALAGESRHASSASCYQIWTTSGPQSSQGIAEVAGKSGARALTDVVVAFLSDNIKLALEVEVYIAGVELLQKLLAFHVRSKTWLGSSFDTTLLLNCLTRLLTYLSRDVVWSENAPTVYVLAARTAAVLSSLLLSGGDPELLSPHAQLRDKEKSAGKAGAQRELSYTMVLYELARCGCNKVFLKMLASAKGVCEGAGQEGCGGQQGDKRQTLPRSPAQHEALQQLQEDLALLMLVADHINAHVDDWVAEHKLRIPSPTEDQILDVVDALVASSSLPTLPLRNDLVTHETSLESEEEWHGCRELGSGLLLRYSAFIQVIPSRLSPPSPSVSH